MPTFSKAIEQVQTVLNALRKELPTHYQSSFVAPTPVMDPRNLNTPTNIILEFQKFCELDIEIKKLDSPPENIVGYCMTTTNDQHLIRVIKENQCWTRYIICKELSHLLVYSPESSTTNINDIDNLFSGLINKDTLTPSISVEKLAYYVAIEMLIPSDIVPDLLKIRNKLLTLSHPEAPNKRLAKELMVPERIVEFRLDKHEFFDDLYTQSKTRANTKNEFCD